MELERLEKGVGSVVEPELMVSRGDVLPSLLGLVLKVLRALLPPTDRSKAAPAEPKTAEWHPEAAPGRLELRHVLPEPARS